MKLNYYVYYRVSDAAASRVREGVTRLQQGIAADTGITGRLLCRRDKPETWMEVYDGVEDAAGFEAALARRLTEVRFAELLGADCSRHTEVFRPL